MVSVQSSPRRRVRTAAVYWGRPHPGRDAVRLLHAAVERRLLRTAGSAGVALHGGPAVADRLAASSPVGPIPAKHPDLVLPSARAGPRHPVPRWRQAGDLRHRAWQQAGLEPAHRLPGPGRPGHDRRQPDRAPQLTTLGHSSRNRMSYELRWSGAQRGEPEICQCSLARCQGCGQGRMEKRPPAAAAALCAEPGWSPPEEWPIHSSPPCARVVSEVP